MREPDFSLWRDYWHIACHRSEVSSSRDYVRLDVAGEEFAVFHDGESVIAFDNLCPHRGARIFDGTNGNAAFRCRYHGWSYSKGKLFVADRSQFAHCDPSALTISPFKTRWVGDFLFVTKAAQHSVEEQFGELLPLIEHISHAIRQLEDFNSYDYRCEWQIGVENALEPYHVGVIHPESLNALDLHTGEDRFFGMNSGWFTSVGAPLMAKRLGKVSTLLASEPQHRGYMNLFLFPFTMISSTFGISYSVQHFLPLPRENNCHFASRLYSARTKAGIKPELLTSFLESTKELNRRVFAEDDEICSRVPARSWSQEAPRAFAKSEERIVRFREAYRRAAELSAGNLGRE